jgi:hypothetical protein
VPITQTTLLTIWMFELTITPTVVGTPAAAPKAPPKQFLVETLVGTARATDVFNAQALSQQPPPNLSHSQVPYAQPASAPAAMAVPPQAVPALVPASVGSSAHGGLAAQVSRSRIVTAGTRAPTPAPPSSNFRQPSQAPGSRASSDPTGERLARCLRIIGAFAEAFMGLKKGYEQFGAEVGVRPLRGTTRLHRARTSQEVMQYVLDPATDPDACARDLNAVFADMGIHDLALMEGISQSVRSLLAKLDPNSFDLKTAASSLWSGGKAKAKWSGYVDSFNNLLGDDGALHAEMFGEEFAAGYASVARGDEGAEEDGGEDDGYGPSGGSSA